MEVRTMKRGGVKHLCISRVENGDAMFVVPLLMLQGMTEREATDGYRQTVEGRDFSCITKKNVSVHCSRR